MWAQNIFFGALAVVGVVASPIDKRQFAYGSNPVRGVNIGGWLVLEPWITPSMFQPFGGSVVDEYTLCQNSGDAESILRSHWDSWVSLGDFQKIADNGFNMVRIPIGYWAFQKYEQDPYIQGAADYLEAAIGWARQTGLKVWIDLHGAPRSQNGYDNSGQLTSTPGWTQGDSVQATLNVIGQISAKYATSDYSDVVVGIELLNEPYMAGLSGGKSATQGYYQAGFGTVRQNGQAPVVIHDGFDNPSDWNGFLTGKGTSGAMIDHHEYQCFTNEGVALSPEDHVSEVWNSANTWGTGQDKFVIVGEWTAAMTDCAQYVNGYGVGARYDGSYNKGNGDGSSYVGSCADKNSIDQWSDDYKQATTNYINAQMSAFESMVQGWIFWNFKTEGAAEWDLFKLIDGGVWPQGS
ncbi:glucan exo-1,3-beta-glucosidase [Exophiala oligosperma]